ncbi:MULTISPECIES: hypothetical protein [unclassified Leisingera]|nr:MULTISPECIES: hypothetical protein [unclassified Leisingera]UWQ29791.1 hypothetical protein K3557_04350 [Leisingera sp. M523]UWQ75986.1 hypothetical protein K3724_05970 [Leisingera sp. M658]
MAEAFLIALATLVIVLYGQTRLEARAIRRNRGGTGSRALILSSRNQ